MPSDLKEIASFLDDEGLQYELANEQIITGFRMDSYVRDDGKATLRIVIRLEEDGELLRFSTPHAYTLPSEASQAQLDATLSALNHLNWHCKVLKHSLDPNDGEIRITADLSIENGTLCAQQVTRLLRLMNNLIDRNHYEILQAITKGIRPRSIHDSEADFVHGLRLRHAARYNLPTPAAPEPRNHWNC